MAGKEISVVLAHGAWADGSSWSKVITGLAAHGVHAVAAPLPLSTLTDDVAAIERAIGRVDGPVVLVGHAYGGTPVSATRHPAVKSLVYVAAVAPAEGETAAEAAYRGTPHPLAPKIGPDDNGWVYLPESAFASAFAPNATADEQAILAAVQRPISVACISVEVGPPRWKELPAWYVVARNDRMLIPANQQLMAERMGAELKSINSDHVPIITAAETVVDTILDAVKASSH
jgi:pimeloyl-ACP methyl ester carboxylesterase